MSKELHTWEYRGPVYVFDILVMPNVVYQTRAVSLQKAKANISYQVKMTLRRTVNSKVTLPGVFTKVDTAPNKKQLSEQLRMDI